MYLRHILEIARLISFAILVLSVVGLTIVTGDWVIKQRRGYQWWAVPLLIGGAACSWFFGTAAKAWLDDHNSH